MREPGAEVVAFVIDEDLGLVLEPPERAGVQHAVAVLLARRPVSALALLVDAAAGVGGQACVGRQRLPFVVLELLPRLEHGAVW